LFEIEIIFQLLSSISSTLFIATLLLIRVAFSMNSFVDVLPLSRFQHEVMIIVCQQVSKH